VHTSACCPHITCVCVRACKRTHTQAHSQAHTHTNINKHTRTYTHAHTHSHTRVCMLPPIYPRDAPTHILHFALLCVLPLHTLCTPHCAVRADPSPLSLHLVCTQVSVRLDRACCAVLLGGAHTALPLQLLGMQEVLEAETGVGVWVGG